MTSTITSPTTLGDLSGTYVLDPAHTRIGFVARHAMVTKVRGQFNEFEGSAVVDADDFTKSSAQLTIQAASIDTRNEQRDGHLKSNDFLSLEEYPQITFVSTGVTQTGETSLELTGDLTIKGVTNSDHRPLRVRGRSHRPVRQPPRRVRGLRGDQPQGLRRQLERRARDRRRAGQREGHPRVRGLGHQEQLTPATRTTWASHDHGPPILGSAACGVWLTGSAETQTFVNPSR